jgi:uncharacterized membrane protein
MQDRLFQRSRLFWWAAVLIVLTGLGLRVWHLGEASLWDDESMTKLCAEAPLDQLAGRMQLSGNSNQMPLYFILLHLFPTDTAFWLRLPAALLGTLGIVLAMYITNRLYENRVLVLMVGVVLALNPYHIWLSRTTRPYALLFVLALLISYFFVMLLRDDRSWGNWLGFVLSSMAAYLTHYYAVTLPVTQYIFLALVLRGRRRFLGQWVAAQFIAAIPAFIWIVTVLQRGMASGGISWIKRPDLADPFLTIWNMTLDYAGRVPWYALLGLVAVFAGLLPGLYYAFRERRTNQVNFYWLCLLVAPLSLTFVFSSFASVSLYVDRYFMALLPALIMLMAWGWTRLPRRAGQLTLSVVLVVGMNNVLMTLHDHTDERQAWHAAAQYVEDNYQPGDGFVMSSQVALLSFMNYSDNLDILDRLILFDIPDAGPDGAPVRATWETPVRRIWAVYSRPDETAHNEGAFVNFDPFRANDFPLSDWLIRRHDQIITRTDFKGVTVFLVDVRNDVYNTNGFGR